MPMIYFRQRYANVQATHFFRRQTCKRCCRYCFVSTAAPSTRRTLHDDVYGGRHERATVFIVARADPLPPCMVKERTGR